MAPPSWEQLGKNNANAVNSTANQAKQASPTSPADNAGDDRLAFNDEKIKNWLFGNAEKSSSNVCCGIYGFDGTSKSGIAMDCRTEEEKKEGYKIIVFDLDGGCAPLKVIYHDNDPNIIIKNPQVRTPEGNLDYEATFTKLKATLDYIERNLDDMKLKAIIFDGVDKFLKYCEYSMREDLNVAVSDGLDRRYWKLRNQKYADVMEQIKLMDVDRFFITHLKKEDEKSPDGKNVISSSWVPDWEKKTPDMMFQKVRCFKEVKVENGDKVTYLKAEVEKCKTNLSLEGKVFTIAENRVHPDGSVNVAWHGLHFKRDNTIVQKD